VFKSESQSVFTKKERATEEEVNSAAYEDGDLVHYQSVAAVCHDIISPLSPLSLSLSLPSSDCH
jgi:hypothetical protein